MYIQLGKNKGIRFGFEKAQSGSWEYTTTKNEIHHMRLGIIQWCAQANNVHGSILVFVLGPWAFKVGHFIWSEGKS